MITEQQRAKNRAYYLLNQEHLKAYSRAYRQAYPEEVKATRTAYTQANREQINLKGRAHHAAHRAEYRESHRAYCQSIKLEVFNAYGGARCACCSETHMEFLSLDHIGGGGSIHRRQLSKAGGINFYNALKKQGYPTGLRVLCMNCNFSLGQFGYCPHGNVKVEPDLAITQNGHSHDPRQLSLEILT